jgi:hypothetical protein
MSFSSACSTSSRDLTVGMTCAMPLIPIGQVRHGIRSANALGFDVRAPDYFLIPASQVVELGTKVEL